MVTRGKGKSDKLGGWNEYIYTIIYKTDKQGLTG